MQPLTYDVLYDVARASSPAAPAAVAGLIAALAGAAGLRYGVRAARGRRLGLAVRVAGTTLVIFGAAWTVIVGGGLYAQHARLRAAMRAGTHVAVEGTVYDRPPTAGRGPGGASWVVAGADGAAAHWYRYDGSWLATGYHRARPGDGGLRDGARVRIADVRGQIARIEVARATP